MATTPHAHRLPGTWLNAIAGVVFQEAVLEQVVRPAIADLQREWVDAGTDRRRRRLAAFHGYVAFWSLVLMAPVAFRNWPSQSGNAGGFFERVWGFEMTMATRIRLTALFIALGLGAGYAASYMRTVLYESSAVMQLQRAQIAPGLVDAARVPSASELEDRLRMVIQVVVSRTRLEKLVKEFGLYQQDGLSSDEAVNQMRRRLVVQPSPSSTGQVIVRFADPDPKTAMRVTERLAAMMVDGGVAERERIAEATVQFLEARIDESRRQLEMLAMEAERSGRGGLSWPKRLELDVLQTTYKMLLNKRADAQALRDVDLRQLGERFVVLDAAQLPTNPMGPTRLELTLSGGAAGLAGAVLVMLLAFARRILRDRRGLLKPTTA